MYLVCPHRLIEHFLSETSMNVMKQRGRITVSWITCVASTWHRMMESFPHHSATTSQAAIRKWILLYLPVHVLCCHICLAHSIREDCSSLISLSALDGVCFVHHQSFSVIESKSLSTSVYFPLSLFPSSSYSLHVYEVFGHKRHSVI